MISGALALALGCSDAGAPAPRPAHLVVVILDTLRADRLGVYGDPDPTSPALDALARRGVVFERVLSQSSWTRPSIGSLLTSRYPRTLGLYRERNEILADDFETLAERLRARGYRTLGLTANPNINTSYNFHQGFDHYEDSAAGFRWLDRDTERDPAAIEPAASLFARALEALGAAPPPQPVYLQLNLMDVHVWSSRKATRAILRDEYAGLFADREDPSYLRLTRQLTDDTAAFVRELAGRPGWEDTLFCIVSDHGEGLSDHPGVAKSRHHGVLVYESQLLVPWILFREGWQPARPVVSGEVRLLDVVPTLLDLLGLPVPDDLEGRSLRPRIEGAPDGAPLPAYRFAETQFRGNDRVAVYSDRWEYIENRSPLDGTPQRELQTRDGVENGSATDRAAEHPDVVEAMREELAAWETSRPRAHPTPATRQPGEEERRQLEAIGYLQD